MDRWLIVYVEEGNLNIKNVIYRGSKSSCYETFKTVNPETTIINMINL